MVVEKRSGPAPKGDGARVVDQLAGQIDESTNSLRQGVQAIIGPRETVEAIFAASALTQCKSDTLNVSFAYRIVPSGDLERARTNLAVVKEKPASRLETFRAFVQQAAGLIH